MKRYWKILIASVMALCLLTAFGCGTTKKDKRDPEKTTQTTFTAAQTTQSTAKSDSTIDPMLPLPDIDAPIESVEPNVPESGVTGNGSEGVVDPFFKNGEQRSHPRRRNAQKSPIKQHEN